MDTVLSVFEQVAADPLGYARKWKQQTGRRVIGLFPMHFPGELAHAAGALPIILQEDDERYELSVELTKSERYVIFTSSSQVTSESRYLRSDEPTVKDEGGTFSDFAKADSRSPEEHAAQIRELLEKAAERSRDTVAAKKR